MMRRVDHPHRLNPTLAYIAPDVATLCEPDVHQELAAIEALGWSLVPVAIEAADRTPRLECSYARDSMALNTGTRLQRLLRSLGACFSLRGQLVTSFWTLVADMRQLGWSTRRCWALPRRWLMAVRAAPWLQAHGCTHVHAHGANEPAQVAMYAAGLAGISFTCMAYGRELFRHSLLLREIATRSKGLLTSSRYNQQWLETQGVDAQQIAVVRCSPRVSQTTRTSSHPFSDSRHGSRGLRTGPFRIGVLGHLVERKGVDDLLQALSMLIRQGCAPVRLLIAGQGPERLRLQVQADRLGIHACVEFVGDVAPDSVGNWLRTLDLFVAACKPDRAGDVDGIPIALVEAMAAGVPVVATRVTGIPELVIENQTGFLAEPGQPVSLAEQIDLAMGNPERARALAQAGRAHARWEFGRERNIRRLVSHFGASDEATESTDQLEQAA